MSKNQMASTAITVPVMMIFSFVPIIAMFNVNVKKIGSVLYTQQIDNMLAADAFNGYSAKSLGVIFIDLIIFIALFAAAYRKNGINA